VFQLITRGIFLHRVSKRKRKTILHKCHWSESMTQTPAIMIYLNPLKNWPLFTLFSLTEDPSEIFSFSSLCKLFALTLLLDLGINSPELVIIYVVGGTNVTLTKCLSEIIKPSKAKSTRPSLNHENAKSFNAKNLKINTF